MKMTNWKNWAVGSAVALTIMASGFYAAETVSAASPAQDVVGETDASMLQAMRSQADQMQRGRRGIGDGVGERAGIDGDALFAEALGVTVEELETARESARTRAADEALAQAVTDGKLTQAQADALKTLQGLGNGRFTGRFPMAGGNYDAYLAEALGITEDEMQAARDSARIAGIEQAVTDGTITQEQADEMLTRLALKDYVQVEMEAAFETAIQKAVADGVITQEQADEILSQGSAFGRGVMGGRIGMPGGNNDSFHGRGHEGMRGKFPGMREGGQGQGSGPKSQSNENIQIAPDSTL